MTNNIPYQLPSSNINLLNDYPEPMFESDSFIVPVNCSVNNFLPTINNTNTFSWNPSLDLSRISITIKVINDYIEFSKLYMFNPLLSNSELYILIKRLIDCEEEIIIESIKLNDSEVIEDNDSHMDYQNGDVFHVKINNVINIDLRESQSLSNNDDTVEEFNNNLNTLVDVLNILIDTNIDDEETIPILDDEIRNETMTLEEVNSIPCQRFSELELENKSSESCIICQENYKNEDNIIQLKCNHIFHKECLENWLLNYNCVCPICRRKI